MDLYGRVRLAELLRDLDELDGLEWIRILYAYPIHFTDELDRDPGRHERSFPIWICRCSISTIECCGECSAA